MQQKTINTFKSKLIRDKIPEILKKAGLQPETYICDEPEYKIRLKEKLREEVQEFLQDNTLEELADILEVIYTLAKLQNCTKQELESIRAKKALERGTFEKRIILIGS